MTATARRAPPGWLNALMRVQLRTPGLQRLVGRSTALVTFTGRRSGRRFTTPISYTRIGSRVILTAHRSRKWWRNLSAQPRVVLRLAGIDVAGHARVLKGEAALDDLTRFLERQRLLAKATGVSVAGGKARRADVERVLEDTVVVAVDLDGDGG